MIPFFWKKFWKSETHCKNNKKYSLSLTGSWYVETVSYQWDLDGDWLYGAEDTWAEPEKQSVTFNYGDYIVNTTAGLKVTDSYGACSEQSKAVNTVAVSNVYPVSYELVSEVYNRRTLMWTVSWRVNITNAVDGTAKDVAALLYAPSIPAGVTVTDDTVSWTTPDTSIDPAGVQLSDDVFTYSYPRTSGGPDLSQITWELFFTDNLGDDYDIQGISW